MSLYVVQITQNESPWHVEYLCRGRIVRTRNLASIYSSPSAAKRAGANYLKKAPACAYEVAQAKYSGA